MLYAKKHKFLASSFSDCDTHASKAYTYPEEEVFLSYSSHTTSIVDESSTPLWHFLCPKTQHSSMDIPIQHITYSRILLRLVDDVCTIN